MKFDNLIIHPKIIRLPITVSLQDPISFNKRRPSCCNDGFGQFITQNIEYEIQTHPGMNPKKI